ncbi:hypothetical protein [Neptuniibacter caesariensis]|uniref:hypothetical protein n=1 Tax=Neptuniibacter caesariensis TaxID=207954 RepID=UPI003B43B1B8
MISILSRCFIKVTNLWSHYFSQLWIWACYYLYVFRERQARNIANCVFFTTECSKLRIAS